MLSNPTIDVVSGGAEDQHRRVVGEALAAQLADLVPTYVGRRLGAVDLGCWGVPGRGHRTELVLGDPGATPRASVRIGPDAIVVAATPGSPGPCPTCLDTRWIACRSMEERVLLDEPAAVVLTAAAPLPVTLVRSAAALLGAVAEWLEDADDSPSHPVWEVSRTSGTLRRYGLLRSSDCQRCGCLGPDERRRAAITIDPVPSSSPGGGRSLDPESLRLPTEALANPVCGALGSSSIRSYQASPTAPTSGRFVVRSKYALHEMWWGGHAESYARSELLGMLEGLERAAGQRNLREPVLHATSRGVSGPFVEMEQCGLYGPEFYSRHADSYVPWSDCPSIPWVRGWSLRDRREVLVPEQLVYYLDWRPDHKNTVQECSNGCASGSSRTEAILHGLLELIERDAFLLNWYAGERPPEIDLDTVRSPLVQQMRAHLDRGGYDLRCFDLRVDVPVPAVGAVAVRRDGGPGALCFAAGASLDPADAVRAAVCEVASYVSGLAERVDRNRAQLERMAQDYLEVTDLEHHALLFGLPQMVAQADHWLSGDHRSSLDHLFADWNRIRPMTGELGSPVRLVVDLLADLRMDTVVVDQTTPEQDLLGLTTVAVVVPGLVPIDFGWERQRVLTMPRTLWAHAQAGLRAGPLTRDDLHAVPHPFP